MSPKKVVSSGLLYIMTIDKRFKNTFVLKAKLRNNKRGEGTMKKGVNIEIFAVMFILDER